MEVYNDIKIKVEPINEVLANKQIQAIKRHIEKDKCHQNSWLLSGFMQPLDVEYCEGYVLREDGKFISHSFNCYNGRYIDISSEIYYPSVKNVYLRRKYSFNEIDSIFKKEGRPFITFDGTINDDGIIKYNDEGQRVISNEGSPILTTFYLLGKAFNIKFDYILPSIDIIRNEAKQEIKDI